MPAATRLGDNCTGHPKGFPPRPSISGSPNVSTNSKAQVRVGDAYAVHCAGSCHGGSLASGSPNVFVNSRAAGRIGDPIDCGSNVAIGSGNVFINGG